MPRIHKPGEAQVHRFDAEVAIQQGQVVVKGTGEDEVKLPAAANDTPTGIALNDAAAGEQVDVAMHGGPVEAIAGGAIAFGDHVAIAGTNGRVVAVTPGVTTADLHIVGKCVETVGADGDRTSISVAISNFGAR